MLHKKLAFVPKGKTLEFLPAVLEIQEAPPSPVGRAVAWTIMLVFAAALLWASLSTVDIVAVAQGKIIPSDHSKIIQPLESGVITAIHVQNGTAVRKGAVLLELDPTANSADRDRLANELQATRLDIARLRAVLAGKSSLEAPTGADRHLLAVQQQLLRDQLDEHRARLASTRLAVEQKQAAVESTRIHLERLRAVVPILEERATVYHTLFQKTYASRMQYLEAEKERIEKVKELASQEQQLVHDTAELAVAETQAASLAQDVAKAGKRAALQTLTAPIDGIVQQLAVHTVGGVVHQPSN